MNSVLMRQSNAELAARLRLALPAAEWTVTLAPEDGEAVRTIAAARPDVVIVDVDRAGSEDFISAVRDTRAVIIALTNSNADEQAIRVFDLGADIVYTKPIAPDLLRARLNAAVRYMSKGSRPGTEAYVFEGLSVDLRSPNVSMGGAALHLTGTEHRLLQTLVLNAGRIMTHAQLIREVWGEEYGESHDLLRTYISALRRLLRDAGLDNFIQTERQLGYWVPRPSAAASESATSERDEDAAVNSVERGMSELRLERERLRAETERLLAYMHTLLLRAQELAGGGDQSQMPSPKKAPESEASE